MDSKFQPFFITFIRIQLKNFVMCLNCHLNIKIRLTEIYVECWFSITALPLFHYWKSITSARMDEKRKERHKWIGGTVAKWLYTVFRCTSFAISNHSFRIHSERNMAFLIRFYGNRNWFDKWFRCGISIRNLFFDLRMTLSHLRSFKWWIFCKWNICLLGLYWWFSDFPLWKCSIGR